MLASLPVSLALALSTMAATASLHVTGIASPGAVVSVQGSAMPRNQHLTLTWDGSTSGMPTVRADRSGTFTAAVTIPATASIGTHTLAAETTGKGGGKSKNAPSIVASVTVQVVTASASPTPTPRVTPTPTPTPRVTPTPTPTVRATPTPTPTPSPGQTGAVDHVFVIVMENHSAKEVYGTSSTPYTTSLANHYARAANYFALGHPSLPNYLNLYAGTTNGITTDCNPSASCTEPNRASLVDNLTAKGLTWKAYFEGMPSACDINDGGTYRAHHDPIVYFPNMWQHTTSAPCATHVVPMFPALTNDLASAATTPNWAWVKPDNCHDTHDCSIATGDTWLSQHIPTILNSPACTVDTCLVALTWDEDDGSQSNQVLTVFAGSAAKLGVVSSVHYDHYDLLRTVESLLGVPTQTANDGAGTRMSDLLK